MIGYPQEEWELTQEDLNYFNKITEAVIKTKIAEYLTANQGGLATEELATKTIEEEVAQESQKTYDLVGEGYEALMEGLPRHLQQLPRYETRKIEEEVEAWNRQLVSLSSFSSFMDEVLKKNMSLQKGFKLSNETIFTFYQVARDFIHTRELRKALAIFYLLIQLCPKTYEFWLGLAACYFDLSHFEEAIPAYMRARELKEDDPTFDIFLAQCQLALGDPALAEDHLHLAKDKLQNSPNYEALRPLTKELLKKIKLAKRG